MIKIMNADRFIECILVDCPLCKRAISGAVENCPHCHVEINKKYKRVQLLYTLVYNLFLLTISFSLFAFVLQIFQDNNTWNRRNNVTTTIFIFICVVVYLLFKLRRGGALPVYFIGIRRYIGRTDIRYRREYRRARFSIVFTFLMMSSIYYVLLNYDVRLLLGMLNAF